MIRRLPLVAALGAVLLLAGCTSANPTAAPPGSQSSDAPSTSAAPTPTRTETNLKAGDCTEAEMDNAIPTIYTVYTMDATTPVTINYMAFNHDGSTPIDTLTTTGPVITIVGYACTDAADGALWKLTATTKTTDSVGCVLAFGGTLVRDDSKYAESGSAIAETATCTGNPGQ